MTQCESQSEHVFVKHYFVPRENQSDVRLTLIANPTVIIPDCGLIYHLIGHGTINNMSKC